MKENQRGQTSYDDAPDCFRLPIAYLVLANHVAGHGGNRFNSGNGLAYKGLPV